MNNFEKLLLCLFVMGEDGAKKFLRTIAIVLAVLFVVSAIMRACGYEG